MCGRMAALEMEGEFVAHKFLRTARISWWIEIDADATRLMVEATRRLDRAYALLHESGALMRDENGPIVAATWSDACALARSNSAEWVLALTDRRAIRVTHGKTSVYAEGATVLLVPNKEALESLTLQDNDTHQEIAREEANAKDRKRPSGAANRRRRRG